MKLIRGGHAPVPTSLLTVVLSWQSEHEVDAHALLLADGGRVRSDRDFVFFNAPRHISQAVTLDQAPAPGTARLSVSLPRTESDVTRIVLTGSVDADSFTEIPGLVLTVFDHSRPVAWFEIDAVESVRAMMFGEFYRRDGQWRFRAIAQGWASGLAGIVTEFGVEVDDAEDAPERTDAAAAARHQPAGARAGGSAPWERRMRPGLSLEREAREIPPLLLPPPHPERADWHVDPEDPARLRWWDAAQWTSSVRPVPSTDARHCPRCGRARRWRWFGRPAPCRECSDRIEEYLEGWVQRAARVLRTTGTHGADWEALWTALRYQRIDQALGLERLRPVGHDHVERLVAFAFADGVIEQAERDAFDAAVGKLALTGPLIEDLRRRMQRGHTLSRLRAGDLPVVRAVGLHLDPEEKVHLDVPAIHIRQLSRGPKHSEGRLICSNKKLRFVGTDTGIEMPWARVVSVISENGRVVLAATSARGGAIFDVADPDYTAASLEGALRVAKRLALTPGQRDTRSIPQEVKAEVWQRDGGKCVECGDSHYLEFDHIIPLSRGGATSAANLQILCRACNRSKGARI
ncbi:TerD family protein [Nocardia otitidiscaviarum]|uniref:TerD family protein n=1 Tax=Nocardia otitidiscaviarum TaxID=1823 RepID=UPI0004A6C655|nr:TerD family protein [Nocardia otitidiscaviarum]MBF6134958.1 TerD family protein [Nocardia otitidiscaviarum]MBF6485416.1 TerD family protein [Nocardia otitidiscaviarum]